MNLLERFGLVSRPRLASPVREILIPDPSGELPVPTGAVNPTTTPRPFNCVTATQLLRRYRDNAIEADAAFGGLTLHVAGMVTSVQSVEGRALVLLAAQGTYDGVCCSFLEPSTLISALAPGDLVEVVGVVKGSITYSIVLVGSEIAMVAGM